LHEEIHEARPHHPARRRRQRRRPPALRLWRGIRPDRAGRAVVGGIGRAERCGLLGGRAVVPFKYGTTKSATIAITVTAIDKGAPTFPTRR
jgi:hypothetical protein